MGRPIIQLPEDVLRIQEVIYRVQPDVIIETGVAHGGSLIFYASLFKAMGRGRVIGIDIEIRPHNRRAIEAHEMKPLITLIEGSSIEPSIVEQVRALITPGETVLVLLDSNHTKAHVLAELEAYGPFVTPGSYIVATDGIMKEVAGAPRTGPDWDWNNPLDAAREFAAKHPGVQPRGAASSPSTKASSRSASPTGPRAFSRETEACSAEASGRSRPSAMAQSWSSRPWPRSTRQAGPRRARSRARSSTPLPRMRWAGRS